VRNSGWLLVNQEYEVEVLLLAQEPIPGFFLGENRIDQRMPPEPDHRLLSPSRLSARRGQV